MAESKNGIVSGDQISDMDGHKPTWKSYLDWEVYFTSVITSEVFYNLHSKMENGRGDLLMNKMAYAVTSTTDIDGEASSVLVIYRYDYEYRIAMLFSPKWKDLI